MKTFLVTFSLIFILTSCTDSENNVPSEDLSSKSILQNWKLYKMTGSIQGSETTGSDMEWQESYQFNGDSTFSKTRVTKDNTISASGSFTTYIDGTEEGILLNYQEESPIIGNCTQDNKEYLYFDVDNDILLSNWWACDGPGLFYQRD